MKGRLYKLKPGRQRPLWKYGALSHQRFYGHDDVCLTTIMEGDFIIVLDDYPTSLTLQWYKVLFKDMVGWLQAGNIGFNDLFELQSHRDRQDA